jgi:hypothetical protein
MSSPQAATTENKSSRRRRPSGGRRRRGAGKSESGEAKAKAAPVAKEAEKRPPRPDSLPVPAELMGKKCSGRVSAIVKKGRLRFGFIHIGPIDAAPETLPRIYFNLDDNQEIRTKYLVEFVVAADEKGRAYASQLALTPEGKVLAAEREAALAARKAAEKPAAADGAEKQKSERPPREKRVVEERNIFLRVTCHGNAEEKRIEFNAAQSVGKLKNVATTAFDAPITLNVYHISAEEPAGVFLTKAILSTLKNDDKIHLGEPRA